jgi:hypothetical protein
MVPRVLPCRPGPGEECGCVRALGIWTCRRGHRTQLDCVGAQAHERRSRREGNGFALSTSFYLIDSFCASCAQPKLWTELQAGIECLTQLLALLEAMASASSGAGERTELQEAADLLQQQVVYNGQALDAALDGLRAYKDGTQSLTFLRASVHLSYALMRMLEKWARTSGDGSYVRKRAKPKKRRKVKGPCRSRLGVSSGLTSKISSQHGRTGWCSRC